MGTKTNGVETDMAKNGAAAALADGGRLRPATTKETIRSTSTVIGRGCDRSPSEVVASKYRSSGR